MKDFELANKMAGLKDLAVRFSRAKDMEEKWHIMNMTYANGFTSVGGYMLNNIRYMVKHIKPEYGPWLEEKFRELDQSDFSGSTPGER